MSPVMMAVFLINKKYSQKIASSMISLGKNKLRKLTVKIINDTKNINNNNFVALCDEEIYNGFSKHLGECELSVKLYKQTELVAAVGGDVMGSDDTVFELRNWISGLDGMIQTTFVCCLLIFLI